MTVFLNPSTASALEALAVDDDRSARRVAEALLDRAILAEERRRARGTARRLIRAAHDLESAVEALGPQDPQP